MEERIRYLFRRYLHNACTPQELEEFLSCVRSATDDSALRDMIRKVYEEAGQEWSSATYVNVSGRLVSPEEAQPLPVAGIRRIKKRRMALVAAAVSVLVVTGGIGWYMYNQAQQDPALAALQPRTRKSTERSEYKYLLLPDSTQVWLNASSTLEYPDHFKSGRREVYLLGEAYFDVAHADRIPFIIHTGKVSTAVLGTAFNIKAYPGTRHIVVSVSRGKVRVSYNDQPLATLVKGQQVKVSSSGSSPVEAKPITAPVAAWQQGNMVYDDETFEDIISDLERVYNVTIRVSGPGIRATKLSTSFRREIGVEQALQVLCRLTDTQLTRSGGVYLVQ